MRPWFSQQNELRRHGQNKIVQALAYRAYYRTVPTIVHLSTAISQMEALCAGKVITVLIYIYICIYVSF